MYSMCKLEFTNSGALKGESGVPCLSLGCSGRSDQERSWDEQNWVAEIHYGHHQP